jgi:hypothetical protein
MPPAPSLVVQTTYAELLERSAAVAFSDAFPEDGTFTPKTINNRRYWYFQHGTAAGRVQRYVGPDTPELLEEDRTPGAGEISLMPDRRTGNCAAQNNGGE